MCPLWLKFGELSAVDSKQLTIRQTQTGCRKFRLAKGLRDRKYFRNENTTGRLALHEKADKLWLSAAAAATTISCMLELTRVVGLAIIKNTNV